MLFSYPVPSVPCKTRFDACEKPLGRAHARRRTGVIEAREEAYTSPSLNARPLCCKVPSLGGSLIDNFRLTPIYAGGGAGGNWSSSNANEEIRFRRHRFRGYVRK